MTKRIKRQTFMIHTLLISLLWVMTSSAADIQDELSNCAGLIEDKKRLLCYDRVATQLDAPSMKKNEKDGLHTESGRHDADQPAQPELTQQAEQQKKIQLTDKGRWLGIRPYRRNYILPVTYNSKLSDNNSIEDFRPEDIEIKFQLSYELPVWKNILEKDVDLYFAYTQLSFFQAYNTEYSSPFRDTLYEPELGLNWQPGWEFMGWHLLESRLALNHQSNGRTEPLSRSWNRLIGQFRVKHDNLSLGVRLWTRLHEDGENDDNPDIIDYMGHGEFSAGYDLGRQRYGLMLRNPLDDKRGVQLGWSYLLNDRVRLYVQYFNGYGEDLIDYDRKANRIGIGFLLNEWP